MCPSGEKWPMQAAPPHNVGVCQGLALAASSFNLLSDSGTLGKSGSKDWSAECSFKRCCSFFSHLRSHGRGHNHRIRTISLWHFCTVRCSGTLSAYSFLHLPVFEPPGKPCKFICHVLSLWIRNDAYFVILFHIWWNLEIIPSTYYVPCVVWPLRKTCRV